MIAKSEDGLTNAPTRLGRKLALQHRHRAVDGAHPHARDDPRHDDVGARVGRRLQQRADNHERGPGANALAPTELLAKEGGQDGAEEAADLGGRKRLVMERG